MTSRGETARDYDWGRPRAGSLGVIHNHVRDHLLFEEEVLSSRSVRLDGRFFNTICQILYSQLNYDLSNPLKRRYSLVFKISQN